MPFTDLSYKIINSWITFHLYKWKFSQKIMTSKENLWFSLMTSHDKQKAHGHQYKYIVATPGSSWSSAYVLHYI